MMSKLITLEMVNIYCFQGLCGDDQILSACPVLQLSAAESFGLRFSLKQLLEKEDFR